MALPVTDGKAKVGLAILKPLDHKFIQKVAVCYVVKIATRLLQTFFAVDFAGFSAWESRVAGNGILTVTPNFRI